MNAALLRHTWRLQRAKLAAVSLALAVWGFLLPVIYARMNDAVASRYYIDPKTGGIVGSYNARLWVERWLYHGLHSLDFPWLYNHRPLWDIVVLTLMLGGAALCATSRVHTS